MNKPQCKYGMSVQQTRQISGAHSDEKLHNLTLYPTQAPLDAFEMNYIF